MMYYDVDKEMFIDEDECGEYEIYTNPDGSTFKVLKSIADASFNEDTQEIVIKCECGSDSVGSSKHSSYCPKFRQE